MGESDSKQMKTVAIIGMTGLPARYGGWDKLVEYVTTLLKDDYKFILYCMSALYKNKKKTYNDVTLKYIPLNANGIQSIPYDIISMIHGLRFADIFVILGVSGCLFLPFIRLFSSIKIIVNIDGIEWKRGKWGRFAKWFLKLSEKFAVKYAHEIIADNKEISRYIESEYGVKPALIAYGGDHALKISKDDPSYLEKVKQYPFIHGDYAFTVCRIEPENNIAMTLEAFSQHKQYQLVFVGNWEYSGYGRSLKKKYSKTPNIFLYDPIYDQESLDLLRSNAALYIHGHSVGGTNPSLVEAMNLRLSVIAFDVSFNRETTEGKAEYFSDASELLEIINHIDDLGENAATMLEIAKRRYQWNIIASQYKELFDGQ